MKNSLKLLLSSALLLTLAACQGQDMSSLNLVGGDGIVGGSKVHSWNDISKHVVAIFSGPNNDRSICTAVLIRPNVVLTAAHCVVDKSNLQVGTDVDSQGDEVRIDKVIVHEYYEKTNVMSVNDIALARIAGPLPKKYKPVQLPSIADAPFPGMKLTAVGYGRTGWLKNSESSGRLRKVEIKVDRSGNKKMWIDQTNGKGICHGDSGGPSFLEKNGEYYPVGITSHILFYTNDPDKRCFEDSVLMDVVSYLPWITENLQSM